MDAPKHREILETKKLLLKGGKYNLTRLKTHLEDEGKLDLRSMVDLINRFSHIISNNFYMQKINPMS